MSIFFHESLSRPEFAQVVGISPEFQSLTKRDNGHFSVGTEHQRLSAPPPLRLVSREGKKMVYPFPNACKLESFRFVGHVK
jgi:hypothetical protein